MNRNRRPDYSGMGGRLFPEYTERVERAKSAALAGVNYVQARLLATNTTFLVTDQQSDYKKRLYFARTADISSDRTNRFNGLTYSTTDFRALASSSWLYALIPTLVLEDECASSTMFRVTSYPATYTDDTINPHKYYVKSQGAYCEITGNTVSATYSFQILGRLKIATPTRQVNIETWRPMDIENTSLADGSFYKVRDTIYPP